MGKCHSPLDSYTCLAHQSYHSPVRWDSSGSANLVQALQGYLPREKRHRVIIIIAIMQYRLGIQTPSAHSRHSIIVACRAEALAEIPLLAFGHTKTNNNAGSTSAILFHSNDRSPSPSSKTYESTYIHQKEGR